MAGMTVRNLDDDLKRRPRIRAAENGRSTEQESRDILKAALKQEPSSGRDLTSSIRSRFEPLGGVELELPPREPVREPPQVG